MLRQTKVVSISLAPDFYKKLETERKKSGKSRSQFIKDLLIRYEEDKKWEEIFDWGEKTASQFKLISEEDIVKFIND